jgi:hypothetical protein
LPIHLHIENADGRAKINIEPIVRVVENQNIKPKDLKKAISTIELYREDSIRA